jgi:hypothetical protein
VYVYTQVWLLQRKEGKLGAGLGKTTGKFYAHIFTYIYIYIIFTL